MLTLALAQSRRAAWPVPALQTILLGRARCRRRAPPSAFEYLLSRTWMVSFHSLLVELPTSWVGPLSLLEDKALTSQNEN